MRPVAAQPSLARARLEHSRANASRHLRFGLPDLGFELVREMEVVLQRIVKPDPDFVQLGWGRRFHFRFDLRRFAHGTNVVFAAGLL